jgi:hypothetical protein
MDDRIKKLKGISGFGIVKAVTLSLILFLGLPACKNEPDKPAKKEPVKEVKIPIFSVDSAYQKIEKQLAFGPIVKTGSYPF